MSSFDQYKMFTRQSAGTSRGQFRYALVAPSAAVTLHLLRTLNGTPRGTATAPRSSVATRPLNASDLAICLPLEEAFAAAIRMGNKYDTELFVTGEAGLWQPVWGGLLTEREEGSDYAPPAAEEAQMPPTLCKNKLA